MGKFERKGSAPYKASYASISHIALSVADGKMKGWLPASLTVEASLIMAMVLWALMTAMQAAYRLRDETVGSMAAQFTAEVLRTDEERDEREAGERGKALAGHAFSWEEYGAEGIYISHILEEDEVLAELSGGKWSISVRQHVFDPENFLRKLSLTEQE